MGAAMKVSKQQAAANRGRILAEAGRLFRERGFAGVGVDALAEAAGLSHGALYSQFGSKEQLAAEALTEVLARSAESLLPRDRDPRDTALEALVARYLSARHRDAPGGGCALAALAAEAPRHGAAPRAALTGGLRSFADRLAGAMQGGRREPPEDEALAVIATLVGSLVLARAVDDPALSDRILAAGRARLSPGGDAP
jgi:TetR/AcrR family transcriptional regulator, transcriptional repressor for nem operon